MDWSRLTAWLDEGSTVDWAKVSKCGIGTIYVDPRSANAVQVIADIQAHGVLAGAYTATSWEPSLSGADFADYTSGLLQKFLPRKTAEAPPYMADLEAVSVEWQTEFVARYRQHQPARPSSFTTEPWKDGTVVPLPALEQAGFHWYPQLYHGDMSPADPAAVVANACRWYTPQLVHPFYDGAVLPGDHRDGCVFTLERLV